MKYLSFLIKPASSLCNLRCTYCFYGDVSRRRECVSYGVMEDTVMKKLIDRAFEVIEDDGVLTFAFQGGEPTLAGISYFKSFVEYVKSKRTNQKICYSLQTNGTLLNDEWASFFGKMNSLSAFRWTGMNQIRISFESVQMEKECTGRLCRGSMC